MAQLLRLLIPLLGLISFLASPVQAQNKPALPLRTSSRWIVDANGNRVKMRCANWAGHMEANIPEGLDKQSLDHITNWIAKQGFNCIRLTYSIDHALDGRRPVRDSFVGAAAAASVPTDQMVAMYQRIQDKNPWITANTTTRDVFGAVVDTLWDRHGIMTILDNHVSKAGWCCDLTDGNGWWDEAFGYNQWNSRFFRTRDWVAGLQAMAVWAREGPGHPGMVAMGLRNEIREFLVQNLNNRDDWYRFMKEGGDVVHAAHPGVLILVGGVQSSTDLAHLRNGRRMLDTSGAGGWRDKLVWEMHAYSFTVTFPDVFKSCDVVKTQYGGFIGFVLEQGKPYTAPLLLGEFGVGMTGGPHSGGLNEKDSRYLSCLVDYMQNNDADWAVWAVQGSYYVRQGNVDYDEAWGLVKHDWSDWRNPQFPGLLKDMWKMTQKP